MNLKINEIILAGFPFINRVLTRGIHVWFPLFAMLLAVSLGRVWAADESASQIEGFSKLQNGDTLTVLLVERGCFRVGGRSYIFSFHQVTNLILSITELPGEVRPTEGATNHPYATDLGKWALKPAAVASLDQLMIFYRSDDPLRSRPTSCDHLTFIHRRGSMVIAEEQTDDWWHPFEPKRKMLTLREILGWAHDEKRRSDQKADPKK